MEEELYDIAEHAIDYAFKGKFLLNMYDYLKSIKATKKMTERFIDSPCAAEINCLILDLEEYLEGGSDNVHKQLREGYGHLGKPEARKIKDYLYGILEGAWRYESEKRPGRKRKSTK